MAFYVTTTGSQRQEIADLPPKNRVWDFFANPAHRAGYFAPQPLETASETTVTVTKTVSGLVCWLSRDPIGELGGLNLYGFVGNEPISRYDRLGLSWWNCCDECKMDADAKVTAADIALKGWLRQGSPGTDAIALSLLRDTALLANFNIVGGVAGGVARASLNAILLNLAKGGISKGSKFGWTGAITAALNNISKDIQQQEGVRIWVHLKWKKCEQKSCILPWKKHYNWNDHEGWHPCSLGTSGPMGEGFAASDVDGITVVIPQCASEAISALIP